MKCIQFFLACLFIMTINVNVNAQDYEGNFLWTYLNSTVSRGIINNCGSLDTIEMFSSQPHTLHMGTSAIFPNVTATNPATEIDIDIVFPSPIYNLRLYIRDIDAVESVVIPGGYSSIEAGATFEDDGTGTNTLVSIGGANDTEGWVQFNGPISTISMTYNRPGVGYGLLLDSFTYDCKPSDICFCENNNNKIIGATSGIPSSGLATVNLNVNSGGTLVKKLNISLPHYESLVDPSCIDCDPSTVSMYGKFVNLPIIAGTVPTFTGPSPTGAAEITYEFSVPTLVDDIISLNILFPATLSASACNNKVDYCIKLGFIDQNCKICEQLLCLNNFLTKNNKSSRNSVKPLIQDNSLEQVHPEHKSQLIINPNPAIDLLHVTLPNNEEAILNILDLNGNLIQSQVVSSNKTTLNVSQLSQGTYIISYHHGKTIISEKFIKISI